jgi:branched-chain amino acid transport system permease protein
MRTLTVILADGLIAAATLFLLSLGLTLIFGVLRILNLAHGSIYVLGAYLATFFAVGVLKLGVSPYWSYPALFAGAVAVGLIAGPIIERGVLRRVYARPPAIQLLVTFSIVLILEDFMKAVFGTQPAIVSDPYSLLGSVSLAGVTYPWYDALLIAVAAVFGGSVVWMIRKTRFGKLILAVINDREISAAIGIDVGRIYLAAFTLGALCAALGGALIAPTIAVVPGVAVDVVVVSFAVIAIGGMGSLEGAALGALIVGFMRALAVQLFSELELVSIYLIMVLVLMIKREGLWGEAEVRKI